MNAVLLLHIKRKIIKALEVKTFVLIPPDHRTVAMFNNENWLLCGSVQARANIIFFSSLKQNKLLLFKKIQMRVNANSRNKCRERERESNSAATWLIRENGSEWERLALNSKHAGTGNNKHWVLLFKGIPICRAVGWKIQASRLCMTGDWQNRDKECRQWIYCLWLVQNNKRHWQTVSGYLCACQPAPLVFCILTGHQEDPALESQQSHTCSDHFT